MSVKSLLYTTRLVLGNRFSRLLLSKMVSPCPHGCGTKLNHAIDYMVGEGRASLSLCGVEGWALKFITSLMAMAVKADFEVFKVYAKNPSVRRGLALVLKGIAKYGITVPQKLPAPFLIVWNFTNMCNLRCRHCYQRADRPLPDELTLEEKLRVVDQLDRADVPAIAFSGGEPLIHLDFLPVAREAASRGMYVAVATNGTVITRDYAKKLKEAGVQYVEVSLDSPDPKKHDDFRGAQGSWERAVRGARNCVEEGIATGIAMTLTKANYHEIEEMVDFCEGLGVQRVVFFNFIPTGRGADIASWDLTPDEREEALRTIYRLATSRKIEVVSTAPQLARVALQEGTGKVAVPTHFVVAADPGTLALAEFVGGCGAGRIYAAVEPNGDVTPCVFMPIKVGSLRERGFEEIWSSSPILLQLRDRDSFEEPCRRCGYRYVCGGCRARAYAYAGRVTAPDPGCINFKLTGGVVPKVSDE